MLQAHSLTATNPRKDGIPNTWFSTKIQISALLEGKTSALANALLERAMEGQDYDDRQNAEAIRTHLETLE